MRTARFVRMLPSVIVTSMASLIVVPEMNGSGRILYDASCVVCHGAGATGGIGPRLAGNPILSNDKLFWDRILTGRHMMPPLGDALTPQQISDIHAWLKSLR